MKLKLYRYILFAMAFFVGLGMEYIIYLYTYSDFYRIYELLAFVNTYMTFMIECAGIFIGVAIISYAIEFYLIERYKKK